MELQQIVYDLGVGVRDGFIVNFSDSVEERSKELYNAQARTCMRTNKVGWRRTGNDS